MSKNLFGAFMVLNPSNKKRIQNPSGSLYYKIDDKYVTFIFNIQKHILTSFKSKISSNQLQHS